MTTESAIAAVANNRPARIRYFTVFSFLVSG